MKQPNAPPPPPPSAASHHGPSAVASAIHWAATKGDLRTLRRLVEFDGVDPSAQDGSSHHCETPLFRAAGANHTEIIEYLVDYARVDVNQRDDSSHTALSWTCYFPDNAESVALLLEKGADPTIATHDGRTPLMIASYAGYSDIVRLLLRHHDPALGSTTLLEARIGEENEYHKGCTPLLLAAHGRRWETVGVLLEEGADPTAEDAQGNTVLQLAKDGGAPKRIVNRIEGLLADASRADVLHKARFLNEAAQSLTKAVLQTYMTPPAPSAATGRQSAVSALSLSASGGSSLGDSGGSGGGGIGGSSSFSSIHERHARCLATAPAILKGRVARGEPLPTPMVVKGVERPWEGVLLEERAKAVAAHVIAPPPLKKGLAGGQKREGGLPRKAYRMLMAMLIPRFVERRQEAEVAAVLSQVRAAANAGQGGREGVGVGGVGGGMSPEAAATVASEEDGVEESKGRGFSRERRESADVKQAQRPQLQPQSPASASAASAAAASVPLPYSPSRKVKPHVGHLQRWQSQNIINPDGTLNGEMGVEELEAGMAKAMLAAVGAGGSQGKGRLVRQLKQQSEGRLRASTAAL